MRDIEKGTPEFFRARKMIGEILWRHYRKNPKALQIFLKKNLTSEELYKTLKELGIIDEINEKTPYIVDVETIKKKPEEVNNEEASKRPFENS